MTRKIGFWHAYICKLALVFHSPETISVGINQLTTSFRMTRNDSYAQLRTLVFYGSEVSTAWKWINGFDLNVGEGSHKVTTAHTTMVSLRWRFGFKRGKTTLFMYVYDLILLPLSDNRRSIYIPAPGIWLIWKAARKVWLKAAFLPLFFHLFCS